MRKEISRTREASGFPPPLNTASGGVLRATCALFIVLACCLVFLAAPAIAQSNDDAIESLQKELAELRQSQAAMARDLQSIKDLLNRVTNQQQGPQGPSSGSSRISLEGSPSRGEMSAPITIVEFSDYQCTYCSQYFTETYPLIDKDYIQKGRVRYVFKNLPNKSGHPGAFRAHEAAACAGDQDKYWEMHDRLFANPTAQEQDDLVRYAKEISLDNASFEACLESGKHAGLIEADIAEARKGGVNVSPVFAIGLTGDDPSSLTVMRVLVGAQPYHEFEKMIEAMLASMKSDDKANPAKGDEKS
jgi:protein-disulfide isomerase